MKHSTAHRAKKKKKKIKFSVLLGLSHCWVCVLWGTSCLLFAYVRRFSKHFYSIIFTLAELGRAELLLETSRNVSTWKTEIYILFFIMKNIAEWIFINTLFAFSQCLASLSSLGSGAVFLRLSPASQAKAFKVSLRYLMWLWHFYMLYGISKINVWLLDSRLSSPSAPIVCFLRAWEWE